MVTTVPNAELLIVARLKDEISGGLATAQGSLAKFDQTAARAAAAASAEFGKIGTFAERFSGQVSQAFNPAVVTAFGTAAGAALGLAADATGGYGAALAPIPDLVKRAFAADLPRTIGANLQQEIGIVGAYGESLAGLTQQVGAYGEALGPIPAAVARALPANAGTEYFDGITSKAFGAEEALDDFGEGAEGVGVKSGSVAKSLLGVAAALGAVAIAERAVRFGVETSKQLIKLATDADETGRSVEAVFAELGAAQERFIERTGATIGRFSADLREANVDLFAVVKNAGLAGTAAARVTQILTQVGIDLASVFGKDDTDVFAATRAGILGQSEALQKLGIDVREARVQQEAFRLGIAEQGEDLTEQQKILARLSLIIEGTGSKFGDAERRADSFASAQKRVKAGVEEAGAALGQKLVADIERFIDSIGGVDALVAGVATGMDTIVASGRLAIATITDLLGLVEALGVRGDLVPKFEAARFDLVKDRIATLFEVPAQADRLSEELTRRFENAFAAIEIPDALLNVPFDQLTRQQQAISTGLEQQFGVLLEQVPALREAFLQAGGSFGENFLKQIDAFLGDGRLQAIGLSVVQQVEEGIRSGDPAKARAVLVEQLGLGPELADEILKGIDFGAIAPASLDQIREKFRGILDDPGEEGTADAIGRLEARSKTLREELERLQGEVSGGVLGRQDAEPVELIDTAGLQTLQDALQAVGDINDALAAQAVLRQNAASVTDEEFASLESAGFAQTLAALDTLAAIDLSNLQVPEALQADMEGAAAAAQALANELLGFSQADAEDPQAAQDRAKVIDALLERIKRVRELAGEIDRLNTELAAQEALERAVARAQAELGVDFDDFKTFREGLRGLREDLEGLDEEQLAALAPEELQARLAEQRQAVEDAARARAALIVQNARLVDLAPEEIEALLGVAEQLRQQEQAAIDTTAALVKLRAQGISADVPINAAALSADFDAQLRELVDRRLELAPPDLREAILAEAEAWDINFDATQRAAEVREALIQAGVEAKTISLEEADALREQSAAILEQADAYAELEEARRAQADFNEKFEDEIQVSQALATSLSGALQDIATEGESIGDAFENAGRRFAQSIARMIADTLAFQAVASIFQGIFGPGSFAGFLGAPGTPNLLGNALGNAFSGGNVIPFARGGAFTNTVATQATIAPLALFGEKSPEAIMPLARDSRGQLGVNAVGTGLVVHVTYAPSIQTLEGDRASAVIMRDREAVGRAVAAAIQENPSLKASIRGTGV